MEYSGGQFLPKVDEARCTGCTRCARVCPGLELKGPEAFGADDRYAELDGPCLACYTAHVAGPRYQGGVDERRGSDRAAGLNADQRGI